MKYLLKLEEALMFVFSIFLFSKLSFAWWLFPILLFTPDLSMLGYLGGTKFGALIYNFIHHKALAIGIFIAGTLLANQFLQLAGIILLAIPVWIAFWGTV